MVHEETKFIQLIIDTNHDSRGIYVKCEGRVKKVSDLRRIGIVGWVQEQR